MKKRILSTSFGLALILTIGFSLVPVKSSANVDPDPGDLYYANIDTCTCPFRGANCLPGGTVWL